MLLGRHLRLAGLLAGGLALALVWAASRIDRAIPFPPLMLAERLVRVTPGDIATFFIERLDHLALQLLAAGATVALLIVAALLPQLLSRAGRARPMLAAAAFAAASGAALLAAPIEPALVPSVGVTAAIGGIYAICLAWLVEALSLATAPVDRARRRAFGAVGSAAVGFAVAGTVLGRFVERLGGPDTNVYIRGADDSARIPARGGFPAVDGLSPEITPAGDHYVVDINLVDPIVEADEWRLRVHGLVDDELRLSFDGLQRRFSLVEEYSVLTCISNEVGGRLVGSSRWMGPRLREVIMAVRPHPGARDVVFRCADGYSTSIPIERALEPSALLAIAQNGRPLTQEHGFPCRVRVPALYGIKNAKWIEEIELVGVDHKSYWTRRGWDEAGLVRTQSRIDTPASARVGVPVWVAGVAWAGDRGIGRVDVSLDAGRTWRRTRLHQPLAAAAWTQWAYRWTPERRGSHQVLCRATDGRGGLQEARMRRPHPSGASGYHRVELEVR